MSKISNLIIFVFLSMMTSNSHSGGEFKPSCQIYGSTEKDQIMGYIGSRQTIVSAEVISGSVMSDDGKSITEFSVKKVWRDRIGLPSPNIKVHTDYPETIDYTMGEEYLLYLTYGNTSGRFTTNICLGTKSVKNALKIELELLDKISDI